MPALTRFLSAFILSLGCAYSFAQAPAAPAATSQSAGVALIEDLVAQSAQRHGYVLTWEARPLAVHGIVPPVSGDIATEMRMLQSMLGGERSPLAIVVHRNPGVVRVRDAGSGRLWLSVTDELFSGRIHRGPSLLAAATMPTLAPAAEPAAVAVPTTAPAPLAAAQAQAADKAEAAATVVAANAAPAAAVTSPDKPKDEPAKSFQLAPGLAQAAFARIAEQHDYRLDWAVDEKDSVYAFDFPVTVSGRDVAEDFTTLAKALSLNGAAHFRVDIYRGNRIARVSTKD